ncbi:MAG: serine/threonine protein kinase, partial [Planctomycetaceae bacterium]|nr:serine/threonine protein kinase [Planctomycetaceae bacterium]
MDDTYEGTTVAWSGRGPAKPRRFWPGDVIDGRYEVRGYLGQGGMGAVLRVEDHIQGKAYALKYCLRVEADFRRFAREVRMMERVKHKHVMPVVAANLAHHPPYFVMPLAERSLEQELPRLAGHEAEVLAIFRQICLGVQAIHDAGIVHRDIKPANVLRFAGGRVAVSDLGAAKLESRDTTVLTQTGVVVGTLAFLAPEQFLPEGCRSADIRTDIFQVGKVLYQLLTGRSPVLIEPGALPAGLAHILRRATSATPDDRYQELGEFLDALHYYELSKDPSKNAREA